jgi:hypothetical protein
LFYFTYIRKENKQINMYRYYGSPYLIVLGVTLSNILNETQFIVQVTIESPEY